MEQTASQKAMSERMAVIGDKYRLGHEAAKSPAERQAVREEYERDVNEMVHGKRLTTSEMFGGSRA